MKELDERLRGQRDTRKIRSKCEYLVSNTREGPRKKERGVISKKRKDERSRS